MTYYGSYRNTICSRWPRLARDAILSAVSYSLYQHVPLSVSMERMERCIPLSEAHTGLWTEWPLICLNLKGEHMVGVSRLLMLIPMIGMQVITISNLNGIDLAPGCCNWTPRPSLPGSPKLSLIRFLSLSFAFLSLTRFFSFFLCHSALTLSLSRSPSTKPGGVF